MKSIGEAIENIKRIIDETLKDYTAEERKQLAKQIMDDHRSGKN
jgi:predicted RNase H-like HicB family nuclease